jgi:hypothetical protein
MKGYISGPNPDASANMSNTAKMNNIIISGMSQYSFLFHKNLKNFLVVLMREPISII